MTDSGIGSSQSDEVTTISDASDDGKTHSTVHRYTHSVNTNSKTIESSIKDNSLTRSTPGTSSTSGTCCNHSNTSQDSGNQQSPTKSQYVCIFLYYKLILIFNVNQRYVLSIKIYKFIQC